MSESLTSAASLTFSEAQRILAVGLAKAEEIGQPMNIAVVDAGGNLVSHVRMDGAWLGSIDISINKAFTARAFDMPTRDLGGESQSGGSLFGINTTNDGRIVIFAGGIPLREGDEVVGAIGVSGGTVDQDQEVAEAGVRAL